MMNQWLRGISLAAVLLNAAALGVHYWAVHKAANRSALLPGAILQPLTGLDIQGLPANGTASTAPCHVVRYTSIHCPWSRKDEASWNSFERTLHNHGCDSTLLAPGSLDLPKDVQPVANQQMISVVPAFVAQQINLVATPTTIVLDHDGKVVWSAVGLLQPGDTERALSLLP